MQTNVSHHTHKLIHRIANFIKKEQLTNGAIPWFQGGKLDPWDHSEACLALNIAGEFDHALAGLQWLQKQQQSNGGWYAKYLGDLNDNDPDRKKIESNFVAYPITAVWHTYVCTQDKKILHDFFPMIQAAADYVISKQTNEGDILWAESEREHLPKDALITACSSILRSLECAVNIADKLGKKSTPWLNAHSRLAEALKNKPWRFDRTWESKARFSMDWFYPILSGIYSEKESRLRLEQNWSKFIVPHLGCKCVSDEPWITIAESAELVMALVAANRREDAKKLLQQLFRWQDEDGGFWTGYVYQDDAIWPKEKTTWTAAAIALATDAVFQISPASHLFTSASGLFFLQQT